MSRSLSTTLRTHTCGELRKEHVDAEVRLAGWVDTVRDHGGVFFIHLRDRYGATQVTVQPDGSGAEAVETARRLRSEEVLDVRGTVRLRPEGMANARMPTGEIEVIARALEVLGSCAPLPFEVREGKNVSEEVRLRHRYLDLRNPNTLRPLIQRHRLCQVIRRNLSEQGFIEVETPFLTKSTPEGARDFLIPSRLRRGACYALPQSPQIFKQILMVSGFDRYFQVVRCFRDEDLRADRQPEFTQLDLEMSFVTEPDVHDVLERLMVEIFDRLLGIELARPFPRIPYRESMERYGNDHPDLRHGHELRTLDDWARTTPVRFLVDAVEKGGTVSGITVPGGARYSRKEITDLEGVAKEYGASGLLWFKLEEDDVKSPVRKLLEEDHLRELAAAMEAGSGDLVLAVAGADPARVHKSMGELRNHLARREEWIDPGSFAICWVVDFPLLSFDEEEGRYVSEHHPFTSPREEDLDRLEEDPAGTLARAYDLVLNGHEIGGGSIRIHRQDVQERVFRLLGIAEEEARAKFGFLLDALRFGAPPHGGIALGLDRIAMILAGRGSLRDVIAFPKTASGNCPLTGAPSPVDRGQLAELGIQPLPGEAATGTRP